MTDKPLVKIKYVSPILGKSVTPPYYATQGSAGMDLSACMAEPIVIKMGERKLIPLGFAIQLPSPCYVALIYARSGLATKHGICMANGVGVIDSDYIGEVLCSLINLGSEDFTVKPGDRVAQMVITPVFRADFEKVDELEKTVRGSGGFGSTGL